MEATLEATTRDTFGKNEARRTRREGRVPAVLYGGDGKAATPIAVAPKALLRILHSESGQNTLISLKLEGAGDTRVLVKDFQLDPITLEVLQADIPEHIDIDVSELMLHQGIRVRELPVSPKWKAVSDPDMMLVHVI